MATPTSPSLEADETGAATRNKPPPHPTGDIVAASRRILAEQSRSFRLAARLLPPSTRGDVAVLYAVCRIIDDIADEADDDRRADDRLVRLAAELHGAVPARPMIEYFRTMADRRDLNIEYMLELIRGVRSDLGSVRIQTDDELLHYCYRVAGTVGLMMSPLLGIDDQRARAHAIDLGIAMQLTNICRDVVEDARRNRVYLPAQRLRARGLDQGRIISGDFDPEAVAPVVRNLLVLADDYYDSADDGMHFIPAKSRLAIVVSSHFYRATGLRLLDRDADVTARPAPVSAADRARRLADAVTDWLAFSSPLNRPGDHRHWLHAPLRGLPGVAEP